MAYNIVVGVTPAPGAVAQIDQFEQGLDDTTQAAARTTTALGQMGNAGAAAAERLAQGGGRARTALDDLADAVKAASSATAQLGSASAATADFTLRELEILQRLGAPAREWAAEVAALNHLLELGAVAGADYEAQLMRARDAYGAVDRAESLLAESLQRESRLLEEGRAPLREYEADLAALATLLKDNKLTLDQYDAALAKVQKRGEAAGAIGALQGPAFDPNKIGLAGGPALGPAFDPNQAGRGISEELRREQQILESINKPLREYQAQIEALDRLVKKGEIDLVDFNREMERASKAAGKGLGPVLGPKQQEQPAGGTGGSDSSSTLQSLTSGASMLLAGGAAAGVISLAEHLTDLLGAYREIQDVAIKAANSVQRFTDESHSATLVIDQQMALAAQLHSTYAHTVGLYGRLAESADALSLSQSEITTLTKEFGEAVQVAGKPLEAADGMMRRFAYGIAAGKIETREMRSIMREIPPIADLWTKAFGATRQQLIEMVKDGRVSTEDLMGALLKGSDAIQSKFEKLAETHAQTKERWMEDEKILSQRYDVGMGAGHAAQETVDRFKKDQASLDFALEGGGKLGDLAKVAQQQIRDETRAALANTVDDLKNLTGAFRPIGDLYRKWAGDTAAVRAEVQKLNEPVSAAKSELVTLNKAFQIGRIDVETYSKRYNELLTIINHGIGSQAFKILDPIRIAKAELDRLNNEVEAGANINQEQYSKARNALATAINSGRMPEDLRIKAPIEEAKIELAELQSKMKDLGGDSEAVRRRVDELLTTINDGRLPEAIKIWEGIHLPIEQAARDFRALEALLHSSRLNMEQYVDELRKIAATNKNADASILVDVIGKLDVEVRENRLSWQDYEATIGRVDAAFQKLHKTASGITYRIAPDWRDNADYKREAEALRPPAVTDRADVRAAIAQTQPTEMFTAATENARQLNEQFERAWKLANEFVEPQVKYEQRLRDIAGALEQGGIREDQATAARRRARDALNTENEALEAQKGPMEAYAAALRKLRDQLEAGDISQRKYAEGVDKAKEAMLQATGQAETFKGAMELNWIKMKQDADNFGATVANLAISDFGKLNDAIVAVANGGAVSWGQMADSMIQDLERIFLKMEETKLVGWIVGGLSGGAAGAAGGGAPGFDADLLRSLGVEGFATGGSYLVGGSGGVDSQLQIFRATPGERVTITPPGAYPYPSAPGDGRGGSAAPAPASVVHVHNHYDKTIARAYVQSPGGQQDVLNVIRANAPAIRSLLGRG